MCDPKWPEKITDMLRLGWGVSPKDRSSMDAVCATCERKSNPRRTKKQTRSWMLLVRVKCLFTEGFRMGKSEYRGPIRYDERDKIKIMDAFLQEYNISSSRV
jgi:hypothetical protein